MKKDDIYNLYTTQQYYTIIIERKKKKATVNFIEARVFSDLIDAHESHIHNVRTYVRI